MASTGLDSAAASPQHCSETASVCVGSLVTPNGHETPLRDDLQMGHSKTEPPRKYMTANSTTSLETSLSHVKSWHLPQETLILFDWDDTLCPTTFIHEDPRLKWFEKAPCFANEAIPLQRVS